MKSLETIILIMTILICLNCFANKIKISFPILLVVFGLGVSIIPGIPTVSLKPDIVFLIFLPPLLYEASFYISWQNLKQLKMPIFGMAVGLVTFTTIMVAIAIHYLAPGFSWPLAFLLGAIVSPPDAAAATSVTRGIRLPKSITTLLEGESLINDASALIIYRFALAAVAGNLFSVTNVGVQFTIVAGGGVLIGVLVGMVVTWVHKHIDNPLAETTATIVTPYISYLLAETFGVSGVLSVVATGLFVARYSLKLLSIETRTKVIHFWEVFTFLLNGFVFILIGLQLPNITQSHSIFSISTLIWFGIAVSIITIVARIIWVFPLSYLLFILKPFIFNNKKENRFTSKHLIYITWSSMRGVVSLASALAIPVTLSNNHAFPMRNEILFITFVVILVTLVLQGLSLPFLIKILKIEEPIEKLYFDENVVRHNIYNNTLNFIKNELSRSIDKTTLEKLINIYQHRAAYFSQSVVDEIDIQCKDFLKEQSKLHKQYLESELNVIKYQRDLLSKMYTDGKFNDSVLRHIARELDSTTIALQQKVRALANATG